MNTNVWIVSTLVASPWFAEVTICLAAVNMLFVVTRLGIDH